MKFVLLVGGALLLGGAAALLYFVSAAPPVPAPPPAVAVEQPPAPPPRKALVLAATRAMPFGTLLRREDLTWIDMPDGVDQSMLFVRGAVPDDELFGAALRAPVTRGQALTSDIVVKPGDRAFLASVLSPGMRASSVTLATASSVGGLLQPGDRVDVVLLQIFGQEPALSPRRAAAETVMTNVRIISIDQRLLPTPMRVSDEVGPNVRGPVAVFDPRAQRVVTVELPPADAERLLLAAELGRLDFILRASDVQSEEARVSPTWADAASQALNPANRQGLRAVIEVPQPLVVFRGQKIERQDMSGNR